MSREPLRRVFTTTEEALLRITYLLAMAFDRSLYRKARRTDCARIPTGEGSICFQVPDIIRSLVTIAVETDGIYLRLLEAYVGMIRTRAAEGKSYVEELDAPVCRQFPSPLAHLAGEQTDNFEFQPITVPLIVSFKPIGVMDIP